MTLELFKCNTNNYEWLLRREMNFDTYEFRLKQKAFQTLWIEWNLNPWALACRAIDPVIIWEVNIQSKAWHHPRSMSQMFESNSTLNSQLCHSCHSQIYIRARNTDYFVVTEFRILWKNSAEQSDYLQP